MSLLTVSERQNIMHELGFYAGKVDGVEGQLTQQAYLKLQKAYFMSKECDGKYGQKTDTLLRNLIEFKKAPHFKVEEFKCKCGGKYCTGYPTVIDPALLVGLEKIRSVYAKPVSIKSGFRCSTWNSKQAGSSKNSRHVLGKAADIQISGNTVTQKGRSALIDFWYTKVGGRYAYGNVNGSHPNMGSSVHVDVK